MRKRGGRQPAQPPGAPPWIASFADLMSTVLAFFMLLYSFSSLNEAKFRDALASLHGAFGILPSSSSVVPSTIASPPAGEPVVNQPRRRLRELEQEIAQALSKGDFHGQVQMVPGDQSIRLQFDAAALFDSGKAELRPDGLAALDAVGDILAGIGNPIRIEGHTDSDPMRPNPTIPDNWALGSERARSVLLYLVRFHGIPEGQMFMVSYADHRPVASNDTPEGKAKNRRVEIVVLDEP